MRTGTPLAGAHLAGAQHDQAVDDGLDRIELRGLAAHGYHGVHEHERRDGQRFVVDIVAHTDTRPAAADDDLSRTLDYGRLAGQVVAVLTGPPVALLETLAERIAATVLAHPQAVAVDVTVHKPHAPLLNQPDAVSAAVEFADVVVSVRRDRNRVPVVDPAVQADPAPRAEWASAAPAPALDARPLDTPADPISDVAFAVPDLVPSAADLAAEPSVAPYEAADLVGDLPFAAADPPVDGADRLAAPEVGDGLVGLGPVPPAGDDRPVGDTDQPAASGAEPLDQSAWDQSAWDEPMPPSIPPATVTPAPSSAGAVVVTPGLGPVVAQLASSPDDGASDEASAGPTDEPVAAPEPAVRDEPAAGPDAVRPDPPYTPVLDLAPEAVVAPAAPQVEAPWQADGPDPIPPDRAVPDPVWVPAP
ncbi:MAG: dihydroneopterin aldolase, partial [Cellulomonas sp.]|nr:dihydroneopterin aldolase [Cellulomonas sp.]